MPRIIKSFRSVSGNVVNPVGFRSALPARAKLSTFSLEDNISVTFPFGPQDIDHDNLQAKTVEIARPGKKPILALENRQLRTVSFSAVIADKLSGGTAPITDILSDLETIAANAYACTFTYGLTSLNYSVVVTKFSYQVTYRNNAGEPTRASASIQLTESPVFGQEVTELQAVLKTPTVATDTYTKGGGDVIDEGDDENDDPIDLNLDPIARMQEEYYAKMPTFLSGSTSSVLAEQEFGRDARFLNLQRASEIFVY